MVKFVTNACSAIWWPKLEPILIALRVADVLGALLWPPLPCPLASRMDNSEETRLVLYLFISHKHVKKSVSTGFSCVVALAV